MKKRTLYPVTDSQIEEIKTEIKAMGIRAGVKRNKQKYANGSISIYALGNQNYRFAGDQLVKIATLLVDKYSMESMGNTLLSEIKYNPERLQLFYGSSINWLNPVKTLQEAIR